MTKKADAAEAKKSSEPKRAAAEKTPKVHASKPSSNPFTQQHPGRAGRSASGGTPGARRGR